MMIMARKLIKKEPIKYIKPDGTPTIYVARAASELMAEYERIKMHILRSIRVISTMKRVRHTSIISVRFELNNVLRSPDQLTSPTLLAAEIARMSFVMENCVNELNVLVHSRTDNLQELRFLLTYGQTPKMRDVTSFGGDKSRVTYDLETEPETEEYDQ